MNNLGLLDEGINQDDETIQMNDMVDNESVELSGTYTAVLYYWYPFFTTI